VLCPVGLRMALEVIRRGASGATREALDELLGAEEDRGGRPWTGAIHGQDPPAATALQLAQGLWLKPGYQLGPDVDPRGIDVGKLELEGVNRWAADKTDGMVPAVLSEVAADEVLALTTAAYLHGTWTIPFEPGDDLMERGGEMPYAERDDWQATRLEYTGGFGFVVVLPRPGLAPADMDLIAARDALAPRPGRLRMPRLSVESDLDLVPALKALGLGPAFILGHDLDGLVTGPGAEKALGRVLQRARLEVDERGTRAAAATVATVIARSAPLPFEMTVDRPFLWAIDHTETGTLLFLGIVHDPGSRHEERH
jgi:serine protease inhibitor